MSKNEKLVMMLPRHILQFGDYPYHGATGVVGRKKKALSTDVVGSGSTVSAHCAQYKVRSDHELSRISFGGQMQ